MKDPAFLFYSSDFLSGTMTMEHHQVGVYIRLLCLQHQKGHLTQKDMMKICGTYDEDIFCKFMKDEQDMYYNKRLDDEIARRISYSESRRKNRTTKKDILNTSLSYDKHMVTETETETITDTTTKNKGVKREKKIPEKNLHAFFDSIWSLYPKKEGKGSVSKTQKEILYKIGFDEVKRCVERYMKEKAGTDIQYLKMGSTFFNSGYVDYLDKNYEKESLEIGQPTTGVFHL